MNLRFGASKLITCCSEPLSPPFIAMMPLRLRSRTPTPVRPHVSRVWSWRPVCVSVLAHTFVVVSVWVRLPGQPHVHSSLSPPRAFSPEPIFIDFPNVQVTDSSPMENSASVASSLAGDSLAPVERPPGDLANVLQTLRDDEVQSGRQPGTSPGRSSAAPALSSGLRDPRLYVGSAHAVQPSPAAARLQADFRNRIRTQDDSVARARQESITRRQVSVFGHRVTVFGDSAASRSRTLGAAFAGSRMVMPTDGQGWQDSQMQRQREEFVRDSIRRERARAMRERQN